MNTSAITNQTHDSMTSAACATGIGFLRRIIAGSVLAAAVGVTAVGLAATGQADPGVETPNTQSPIYAPGPPAGSWLTPIDPGCRLQMFFYNGRWHCG
jgi:hypothetical protein